MSRIVHYFGALFFGVLTFASCSHPTSEIPPPGQTNTQHRIPWPSLADSPWPISHGDPQSTGRSRYIGPRTGILEWQLDSVYSETGIVLGSDSTIYFAGSIGNQGPGLVALDENGDTLWVFRFGAAQEGNPTVATPVVAADGTIYVATGGRPALYAVKADGTLKWRFEPADRVMQHALNMGKDGTVWFVDFSGNLYGVSPNGSLKAQLFDNRLYGGEPVQMSFSPDGTTLYMQGSAATLVAFSVETQSISWTYGSVGGQALPPLVDNAGNVYMLSAADPTTVQLPHLVSLASDGNVRWIYVHGNGFPLVNSSGLTMNTDGDLFFALDSLYCVAYDGTIRWKLGLAGWADNPLVCDAIGTVYLVQNRTIFEAYEILAVSSGGQILWNAPFAPARSQDASPALTEEGSLIGITYRGGGYAYRWN